MGAIALAWLAGEGILIWRWKKAGAPPTPGALLLSSGVFAALAVLGQAQQARTLAATMAWGYDLAILLQVFGQGKVKTVTNWPPPMITDGSVILPTGNAHSGSTPFGGAGAPSLGGSGPGGSTPKGPNTTTPGTPVPPGQGVVFPPGSGALLWRCRPTAPRRRSTTR